MIFEDGQSQLEIDLVNWGGDAYVSAKVRSQGFAGEVDLHVIAEEFKQFCKDLCSLQQSLKGKAELNSISPDELKITIQPFNSLGHMTVSGTVGQHISTSQSMNWHSVNFGFEIDPQQLDKAVKVDWVVEHGA